MKRVMIDQGSAAEIMYPDLFKGLGLKPENLTTYSSPLVSFEGKMVVPRGQIRLPVQTGSDVVEVDFIVVDVFSPYTARQWLHSLGAVLGCCFLHPSSEGKISFWRSSAGDSEKPIYG